MSSAILIAGIANGDEGKGKTVDYLARTKPVHTVVRYNGASNAHHNVVTADGRQHAFQQFGSASFVPGVRTHLSRFMLVNPTAFLSEGMHLAKYGIHDIFSRVTVERDALVTTPFQIAVNRLREMSRGRDRHGSCGLGVFETVQDKLEQGNAVMYVRDLENPNVLIRKLRFVQEMNRDKAAKLIGIPENDDAQLMLDVLNDPSESIRCAEWFSRFIRLVTPVDDAYLTEIMQREGVAVFEGAQGVLLDEVHGFFPHCTRSDVTFRNAERMLEQIGFMGGITRMGVMRTYATRHGAGPFMTEDAALDQTLRPEPHNKCDTWQQDFRIGHLDPIAIKYAIEALGGIDEIVLTHLDRLDEHTRVCSAYTAESPDETLFATRGNRIVGIEHADAPSLQRQELITRQLTTTRAQYETWSTERDAFIERLEHALQTPVTVCSTGPTADETFERSASASRAA
ncbi:MAG: adenylosuccinate synthetase [Patescibacteria group bacterium]|nr:adenylosuccinate synthetase [Patescibacteria group bacterium]